MSNNIVMYGLGGCGANLVDMVAGKLENNVLPFYVNTSKTDIDRCKTSHEGNYLVTSINMNGVGRDRRKGKKQAHLVEDKVIKTLNSFYDEGEDTFFFVSSLGGGSGSSLVSVLTERIDDLLDDEDDLVSDEYGECKFKINLILILPNKAEDATVLKNAVTTYNEIINRSCVNSIIFLDNGAKVDVKGVYSEKEERNLKVNMEFASIFCEVVENTFTLNNTNFDTANLFNIFNKKGCSYFYRLPQITGQGTDMIAMLKECQRNSVFANNKMFSKEADGEKITVNGYIGVLHKDKAFTPASVETVFNHTKEMYVGRGTSNLLLLSGCPKPVDKIDKLNQIAFRKDMKDKESEFVQDDEIALAFEEPKKKKKKKKEEIKAKSIEDDVLDYFNNF